MTPRRIVVEVSSAVRRMPVSVARARDLVEMTMKSEKVRDAMVSIAFVGRTTISRYNKQYLDHSGATDVISFGMGRDHAGAPVVGDIYICPDVARANARRFDTPLRDEIERLIVHGALHVAGNDHPDDESRVKSPMWKKQERILARSR
jgi:probable rRNA maturation factor